jgi:ABC-2 type transport system permease protein
MDTAITGAVREDTRTRAAGLRTFWLLTGFAFLTYVRNKAALFWVAVFPAGLMLVLGAMYGSDLINPADPNSPTGISFLAPGLAVLSLMSNGLIGNSGAMAHFREKGILRRIQATPLPVWQLILSRVVMRSVVMVGQAALMIGLSVLVFQARYDWMGVVEAVPWVVLGAVLFMAMGQAIAATVRKVDTVMAVAQVINFVLMFLGSLWTPFAAMPGWLQSVSRWLPSTMVADLVRAPMLPAPYSERIMPASIELLGVAVYLLVSVALAVRFFKWE